MTTPLHAELLTTLGWDLRGLGEAQLRSLTAMQRCINDYRISSGPEAADEIRTHIAEMEDRSRQVQETLRLIRDALREVENIVSVSSPPSSSV